jgi:hypothetical protein
MALMTARTRLAALLALLPVSLVALVGCGDDDEPQANDPNQPAPSTQSASQEPDPSVSSDPAATSDPEKVTLPVYFVGATPQGPRLFREFRGLEADNPTDEALALLTAGDALDPDYSTLLPDGSLRLDTSGPEKIVISLPDAAWAERPDSMSTKEAKLAVQQIVYTVQGIVQDRLPVHFVLDGDTSPILGLDATSGFKAAPQNNVLALVNVTQPEQNSQPGSKFVASGVANSFEATVPWEIRDESGAKVLEGFATAEGWGDHLYPWESEVDASGLAPGTYTFVAMTDDPSGGEGGGPTEDTKTFTVT